MFQGSRTLTAIFCYRNELERPDVGSIVEEYKIRKGVKERESGEEGFFSRVKKQANLIGSFCLLADNYVPNITLATEDRDKG